MERLTNRTEEPNLKAHIVRHGPSSYRQPEWHDVESADDINALGRYKEGDKTPEEIAQGKAEAVRLVRESAEKIAAEIGPDEEVAIWSSPTGRTLETARIIRDVLMEKGINIRHKGAAGEQGIKAFERLGEVRNFSWQLFEPLMNGGEMSFNGKAFDIDKKLSNPENMGYPDYFTSDAIKSITDEAKAQWPSDYVAEIESFESFVEVSKRMADTLKKLKGLHDKKYRVIIVSHDAMAGQIVKSFTDDQLSGIDPAQFISLERKDGKLVVTRVGDILEGNSEVDVAV